MLKNMRNAHRMGGKMDEKWTGPYEVVESLSRGCYKLKATNGKVLKKSYNSHLLKEYMEPFKISYTLRSLPIHKVPSFNGKNVRNHMKVHFLHLMRKSVFAKMMMKEMLEMLNAPRSLRSLPIHKVPSFNRKKI